MMIIRTLRGFILYLVFIEIPQKASWNIFGLSYIM